MSKLLELARKAGLQPDWEDAAGTPRSVEGDHLRIILAALGLPAATDAQIDESMVRLEDLQQRGAEQFLTALVDQPIVLPNTVTGPATLELESGATQPAEITDRHLAPIAEAGYHRLVHPAGATVIAVAPPRCFGIGDLSGGSDNDRDTNDRRTDSGATGRLWGAAVQLPSLRGDRPAPFGDFRILNQTARALAGGGADLIAISPVHALFPSDSARFSPYSPSSRRFLNALFADPSLVGSDWKNDKRRESPLDLIDWENAIVKRLSELHAVYQSLDEADRRRVARVERIAVEEQRSHALFDALDAHFRKQGLHGWHAWPEEYRDPDSASVRKFEQDHQEEIAFHFWLQGLVDASLAAAQKCATDAGMAVGIVTDLAVGVDPGGSDCWANPQAFMRGLSVGAPPDLLGPDGQDWGLTTFDPLALPLDHFRAFRDTLVAAMAAAGGVRIDHVLGLRRIWVIPRGHSSSQGCYIEFPLRDMLRILALESWRNRAIVVGEDLGTVPEGLREKLGDASVLGMRVLWFERDGDGAFTDPADWDELAVAMTSTHDLATLAGWWSGRDIEWNWSIGRSSRFATKEDEFAARRSDRADLWQRIVSSGNAEGPCPAEDETQRFVDAACAHVSSSKCVLAIIPLEDLFGVVEQPNLPGTIDEHPNWRRRLPDTASAMMERPCFEERIGRIAKVRRAWKRPA